VQRTFWTEHAAEPFDLAQSSSYGTPGLFLLENGHVPIVCRLSSHSPSLRAAYGRGSGLADQLGDWMEARLATRSEACFAPSRLIAETFERLAHRPVSVIRTPASVRSVTVTRSAFERHRPRGEYLLFFGTLSRIKGVDLLADALPPILRRRPQLEVFFIGRDDGLPDGTSSFSQVAERCGAQVKWLPSIEQAEL